MEKRRRRDIIRELIITEPPTSQKALVEGLAARGIKVDQSTVSRDLREMSVVRLPGRDGGLVYTFAGEQPGPADVEEFRRGLRDFAIDAVASGNLVVLHTAPGNAQALAAILDRSRLEEVAGTIAGDDTIVIVVLEGCDARRLADRMIEMSLG
jgi:transcriptional regulator of arginine metabolism